jgi:hypothetical protein
MATIVTVTWDYFIFLHEAADLSNYLKLAADRLVEGTGGQAEVRLYGRGNARRRSAPGVLHSLEVGFEYVTRAEKEALLEWVDADTFLMLRDPRGRVVFGAFDGKSLSVTELQAIDRSTIAGSFNVVSAPPDPTVTV